RAGATDEARESIRLRLGDALANAGRGPEAAAAYDEAAQHAAPADRIDIQRKRAEQLLRSGHIDEGFAALRELLNAVGLELPPTPGRALFPLLRRRAQIAIRQLEGDERGAAEIPPAQLTRIDICWSVAMGLANVDTVRGA